MEARALVFLLFAPCTGKGPGLGLEGGLGDFLLGGGLCLLASEEERKRSEEKNNWSFLFSLTVILLLKMVAAVEMIRGETAVKSAQVTGELGK